MRSIFTLFCAAESVIASLNFMALQNAAIFAFIPFSFTSGAITMALP
jgi:hypothetical protein